MPKTLHGTGGTQRELVLDLAMDAYARGHSVPLAGNFKAEHARLMGSDHVEATLTDQKTGLRYIICGDTKVGDPHVCSG